MIEYKTAPEREGDENKVTGIGVRAKFSDGKFGNADIAQLDKGSLVAWLKSRGGDNPWAEGVVVMLMGWSA